MSLAAWPGQSSKGADQAFAADREVVERASVALRPIQVVGQWVLVPRLAEPVRLAARGNVLNGSSRVLNILGRHVVHLGLRLVAVRTSFILRFPHVRLLHLILLVHFLHSFRLEVVHGLPAVHLLLLALVLEVIHACLLLQLDLLLVALNDDVGPVSSDEDFGWHAGVQLTAILLDLFGVKACLVARKEVALASVAWIASCRVRALHLAHHRVRESVWPNAQHSVPPVSHGHTAVAPVLLPQG